MLHRAGVHLRLAVFFTAEDAIRTAGRVMQATEAQGVKLEGGVVMAPTVEALTARSDLSPEGYARTVLGWVEMGATIVGGCCEIGPAHIAALARALTAAGHRIV